MANKVFNISYYDDDYNRHMSYGLTDREVQIIRDRYGNGDIIRPEREELRPEYIGDFPY